MSKLHKQELIEITPNQFRVDSLELARKVYRDILNSNKKDFNRTVFIVALWRGGALVGHIMQRYFEYHKFNVDHICIRTSRYDKNDQELESVNVYGQDYLVNRVKSGDVIIYADDIFDKGLTMLGVIKDLELKLQNRKDLCLDDLELKIATVYEKDGQNKTELKPNWVCTVFSKNPWVVFPEEYNDMQNIEKTIGKKESEILKNP